DVFIVPDGATEPKQVRILQRGDVCGEMGLIRHHTRTADIIAKEDVEVIAVDERFLNHMQNRYPRIGAKIFLNIAKILSDRLQDSQQRQGGGKQHTNPQESGETEQRSSQNGA